jgi:hypothetical protein
MKILTLFLIALMIFAASPVFACGDSSGEDKDRTLTLTRKKRLRTRKRPTTNAAAIKMATRMKNRRPCAAVPDAAETRMKPKLKVNPFYR